MIEAKTYLWLDEGTVPMARSVLLETFEGQVGDPDYINGVIDLRINGEQILGRPQWDLVDQLWAYIVNGACEVALKKSFSTYFPDQPLQMIFTVSPAYDTVTVNLGYDDPERDAKVPRATMPRREFIAEIAEVAEAVFRKLIQLVPENRQGYESVLRQIEGLRHSITLP